MTPDLLDILRAPARLPDLDPANQGQIVRQARHAGLLGYLAARSGTAPGDGKLADHLLGARVLSGFFDTQIKWEVRCLERALASLEGPVILLKGAAYKTLDMALAQGRLASDVDLLLPRAQLEEAESLLLREGWEPVKESEYEQQYYREWMHELPPLRHRERGTVVDLHHTILPSTCRYKPDAALLVAAAESIPGSTFHTLSPMDTLLHRCAHLFVDGDCSNSLRELVDLRELFRHYEQEASFRDRLFSRAAELGLERPLLYAVTICHELLALEAPAPWRDRLRDLERRGGWSAALARRLMMAAFRQVDPGSASLGQRLSGWLLFLRSHWLRMPPGLLARHVLTQAARRGGLKKGG